MGIDASIYQNIRPLEMPSILDSQTKASNLSSMAMQNAHMASKLQTDQAEQKRALISRAAMYAKPAYDRLASLPEDQRAAAFPSLMKGLEAQGMPMDNIPKDQTGQYIYDPQHFGQSYAGLNSILENNKEYLEVTKLKSDLASAKYSDEDRKLDRGIKQSTIAKNYADAEKTKRESQEGKAPTQSQFTAATFGTRAQQAEDVFTELAQKGFDPTNLGNTANRNMPGFLEGLRSGDVKRQSQAERNFVNAILRRESGAVISPSEFSSAEVQYFPRQGDTPDVLRQKEINRKTVTAAMNAEGAPAKKHLDRTMAGMTIGTSIPEKKSGMSVLPSANASTFKQPMSFDEWKASKGKK